jgi:hypothetical protein
LSEYRLHRRSYGSAADHHDVVDIRCIIAAVVPPL